MAAAAAAIGLLARLAAAEVGITGVGGGGAGPVADSDEDVDEEGRTIEEPDDVFVSATFAELAVVIVKLFCEITFRDFTRGGFLIDDEKAKPRRNVPRLIG